MKHWRHFFIEIFLFTIQLHPSVESVQSLIYIYIYIYITGRDTIFNICVMRVNETHDLPLETTMHEIQYPHPDESVACNIDIHVRGLCKNIEGSVSILTLHVNWGYKPSCWCSAVHRTWAAVQPEERRDNLIHNDSDVHPYAGVINQVVGQSNLLTKILAMEVGVLFCHLWSNTLRSKDVWWLFDEHLVSGSESDWSRWTTYLDPTVVKDDVPLRKQIFFSLWSLYWNTKSPGRQYTRPPDRRDPPLPPSRGNPPQSRRPYRRQSHRPTRPRSHHDPATRVLWQQKTTPKRQDIYSWNCRQILLVSVSLDHCVLLDTSLCAR